MISYMVSTYYDRPTVLGCCLYSLISQERTGDEIIVCDNNPTPSGLHVSHFIGEDVPLFRYLHTQNLAGNYDFIDPSKVEAHGDWLCWPSDDSYYVPGFSRIMLAAAEANGWEFVYCNCVYDPRLAQVNSGLADTYSLLNVSPSSCQIDKTCFMVTRRAFDAVGGWPNHRKDGWVDGNFAESMVEANIKHGKAPGIMCFHN